MSTYNLNLPITRQTSVWSLALRYGIMAFGLMIGYFLLINAMGWQQWAGARFGSHAFTVLAVFLAIRAHKTQARGPAPYLGGLSLGFLVGLVSSLLFAIFLFVYAYWLNTGYRADLEGQTYLNSSLNPFMLAASITLLGAVIGSLTGYVLMMSDGTPGAGGTGESTGS